MQVNYILYRQFKKIINLKFQVLLLWSCVSFLCNHCCKCKFEFSIKIPQNTQETKRNQTNWKNVWFTEHTQLRKQNICFSEEKKSGTMLCFRENERPKTNSFKVEMLNTVWSEKEVVFQGLIFIFCFLNSFWRCRMRLAGHETHFHWLLKSTANYSKTIQESKLIICQISMLCWMRPRFFKLDSIICY